MSNFEEDPLELHNRSVDPECRAKREELRDRLVTRDAFDFALIPRIPLWAFLSLRL